VSDDTPSKLVEALTASVSGAPGLEVPPKCFVDMGAEFVDFEAGKRMRVRFPVYERYAGPTGYMQGGMLTAAFDNTYGPFSYLTAKKPCVTITIDTHFLRPVKADGSQQVEVEVNLRARTRALLFIEGECYNSRNKVVAASTTTMAVVGKGGLVGPESGPEGP